MSKRNSLGASNTLFNYFSKTPPPTKKSKVADSVETPDEVSIESKIKIETKKRERESAQTTKSESDDDTIVVKKRKRIRINPIDSDDSDVENKVNNVTSIPEVKVSLEKKLQDSFKYEANQSPQGRKSISVLDKSITKQIQTPETPIISDDGNWVHCKLDWLKPDQVRDSMKRCPDHPDYDSRTLYVPPEFMDKQTPAHRQWWEMKSSHYDCVLFFKVGKFYELYHMDAAVGVNELGFSYMKGEFAHSGFPESAYARMASTLVNKGYKVARVEQTETPDMMQERCKRTGKNTKWDKVVQREICQVTVRGTQVCGLQDNGPTDPGAQFLISISEEEHNCLSTYGVCFVDTSIGMINLGQFQDDKHSSRLLTTLAHYPPALIICDRKNTSNRTRQLLSTHCHSARREFLPQAWSPEKTLKVLAEKYYKTNVEGIWPEGLQPFLNEGDALGLTPAENCYQAIKALGGCVIYLTDSLLDIQILGMAQFASYSPPDVLNKTLSQETKVEKWEGGNTMVLDAITLRNLRIVQDEGCLFDKLNYCTTHMGKRLLYQWVCAPSCSLAAINERQEAVKTLFNDQELCQDARNILSSLPDLERLLAKVHALGNLKRSKDHPDARAIFYEEKNYSKRKVLDFISVLNGLNAALKLNELFLNTDSALLRKITQFAPEGKFPDYRDSLKFFKESFNQKEAEKEGRILPGEGVDKEYDSTLELINDIEAELKDYLNEQEKYFKCRLAYVGTDKKRYQLEVPQNACSRATYEYHLEGTRKGFKRFSTYETKDLLSRMIAAEEQKRNVLKDLSRRIFEKFSLDYNKWESAVHCLSVIDILLSFAEFARQQSGDVCLPKVTSESNVQPYIRIKEGRHPCIPIVNDFIPNDTELGIDGRTLLLLTGPNMGGKSTLMRQVGLITVLAHLGSFVPAQECNLTLVDRIFTRLGASDDILSGQSTFLLEMNETAAIVKHATSHSLVLLDELGRGTSTYDGTAIASGVCAELADRGCRCVFSTHYHTLVTHLAEHPSLFLGHMACMVETDEASPDNEDHIQEETITFLYKLSPGACPKSYGFNAARLAGIPKEITKRAHVVSKSLEKEAVCLRAFRDIVNGNSNAAEIRSLLAGLAI